MGAASAYGVQTVMNGEQSAPEQETKTADFDSMNFKDAFEAARAEMGPGHVFTWHGNVYTTYTAAEWNAKTHQEQEEFAEQIEPQLASAEVEEAEESAAEVAVEEPAAEVAVEEAPAEVTVEADTAGLTTERESAQETPEHEEADDVRVVAGNDAADVAEGTLKDEKESEAGSDMSADDNDVRVLGYGNIELPDGQVVTVEELEMNGQRVAIIDLDKDGVPDVAMSDLNHNQKADEGEVIDLHTGETLSFTNDTDDVTDVFAPTEI